MIKHLLGIELKSSLRNKRLKELHSTLYLLIIINLILPWLLSNDIYFTGDNKISVALQAIGWCSFLVSIAYSSLSFNWQGSYLTALLKFPSGISTTFFTVILLPYLYAALIMLIIFPSYYFLYPQVIRWAVTFSLFNIGVLLPATLVTSIYHNNKTIALHNSRFLNFQGIKLPNVLSIMIPIFFGGITLLISKILYKDVHLLLNCLSIIGLMAFLVLLKPLKKTFSTNLTKKLNY